MRKSFFPGSRLVMIAIWHFPSHFQVFSTFHKKHCSLISFRVMFCLQGRSWGGGGPGVPVTPPFLGRPSFEQTTYNIQAAKTPWQYLGRKSHCWKSHFFKIWLFVKYFHQRLLSLVNMGLHAAIIRLSPLIHEGEQRWVASVTSPLKNPGYAPGLCLSCDLTERYPRMPLLGQSSRLPRFTWHFLWV